MRRLSRLLFTCGALCLLLALALIGRESVREIRAAQGVLDGLAACAQPQETDAWEMTAVQTPQPEKKEEQSTAGDYLGVLSLPSLSRTLPVQKSWSEQRLSLSPCLYAGTPDGTMVLAGHNYRAHFASLVSLAADDTVTFTCTDGRILRYRVAGTEVIGGSDVSGMLNGSWDLTLFTCTNGGADRIAVRCVKK